MMKSGGYIFIWITFFPVMLLAQGRVISLSERDSVVNPVLLNQEEILHFDTTELNIGSLQEDAGAQTYHFRFRNVGQDTITLTKIQTSCGCAEADCHRRVVAPGEESTLTIIFHPSGQVGTVYKQAFIYTNLSTKFPTAKIALVGEVESVAVEWSDYPYSMGTTLRLRRLKLRFAELNRSMIQTERLVCVNSGSTPLKLSALLLPAYATFRTEPAIIQPGEEADIVLTIDGHLVPTNVGKKLNFPIVIQGINARPSDRTLEVEITLQNESIHENN